MNKRIPSCKSNNSISPKEIKGFDALAELALNMRWSWNHATDNLWQKIDPDLWELTHNPWVVLQTVSRNRITSILDDPDFRKSIDKLVQSRRRAIAKPGWFQVNYPKSLLTCVAYFSMEFMLSEALPIYSGGLGNVAGDQLKAASDLGVPVVGIGLLYQQGYFHQIINKDGAQEAIYPYNDPGQLPITPLRQADGEWLRFKIDLSGYQIWLRTWQVQVGKNKLYLLDSNDSANFPTARGITSELYGGGHKLRLLQELILGIGGWRLLEALNIYPEVCHLNEGHAAFAVLDRARSFMQKNKQPFDVGLAVTRAGNIFTTHTAVDAGFDRFSPEIIEQYLAKYASDELGITFDDLLALGRQNRNDAAEFFNMAYLAIRGSGIVNGVSRLHGQVSRNLFASIFPRWPEVDVPVGYVTNGIHVPSWDSAAADDLWTKTCGKDRWLGTVETLEKDIRCISDDRLWQFRTIARKSLVEYARERLLLQLIYSGASSEVIEAAKHVLDPNILILGFARRFVTYKRPNLLLHDLERLRRLLTNTKYPVQIIIAGKAHPKDQEGQALIQEWIHFIRQSELRHHVIFLSDYDMLLAERLVQGVDVWINTPRRPWEASGTSGMKVLVNGGINLSELDGWWAEAYTSEVGWALGDGKNHGDDPAWDAKEAEELYLILEQQVIPEFYLRNEAGIPTAWVAKIRESMARLTPQFSTNRSVREYTEQHYLPAASNYIKRAARKGAIGKKIAAWMSMLKENWDAIHFGEVKVETINKQHLFEAQVYLNALDSNLLKVELYAEGNLNGASSSRYEMKCDNQVANSSGNYVYKVAIPDDRPAEDYTARIIPHFEGIAVPLEANFILWQR